MLDTLALLQAYADRLFGPHAPTAPESADGAGEPHPIPIRIPLVVEDDGVPSTSASHHRSSDLHHLAVTVYTPSTLRLTPPLSVCG